MRRHILSLALGLAGAWPAGAQDAFTFESQRDLLARGDWNLDGRIDVIIAEKATGIVRVGFLQADGSLAWAPAFGAGSATLTGLAVGRFAAGSFDAFALTSPAANAVTLGTYAGGQGGWPSLSALPTQSLGPLSLAGFDLDATGNTDLVIAAEDGTGAAAVRAIETLRGLPNAPATGSRQVYGVVSARTNAVRPRTGLAPRAVFITGGTCYLHQVSAAGIGAFISTGSGLTDARYAVGTFGGSTLTTFLFHQPTSPTLAWRPLTEPATGAFAFGSGGSVALGTNIDLVVPIPFGGGMRLAVLFTDGTAAVADFNGVAAPTILQTLPGPFAGLLPLDGGDFLALPVGTGGAWQRMRWNGGSYASIATGPLPVAKPAARVSNIIFTGGQPFVAPGASLAGEEKLLDWTTGLTPGTSTVTITGAVSSLAGLSGATSRNLSFPSGATHALINQYRPDASVFAVGGGGAGGTARGDVLFSPPAGSYVPLPGPPATLPITLSPTRSGDSVYYRRGAGTAWSQINGSVPVSLTSSGPLEAYSQDSSGARSPVRSAAYVFIAEPPLFAPPTSPDSDGDGLPDSWENLFGVTDPTGDADGDGVNNLAEAQAGTDPQNAASFPQVPLLLNALRVPGGPSGVLRLTWQTSLGATLQSSADFITWTPIASGITTSGGVSTYEAPLPAIAGPPRFFRLVR